MLLLGDERREARLVERESGTLALELRAVEARDVDPERRGRLGARGEERRVEALLGHAEDDVGVRRR